MSNIIKLPNRYDKKSSKKLSVGVIIQARMGSQRFPGKVMEPLWGKPVLQHVIEKAKLIRGEKKQKCYVVLAVPDQLESEPMLELADKLVIDNFLGSELNVLDRYYRCAQLFKFDVIVRLTADCPLLNPAISSEVLQLLLWRKLDYVSNCYPIRTFPKGLDTEAFTFDCLEAAWTLADSDYDREHVTSWMAREDQLRKACIQQKIDVSYKNWCVDVKEDLLRLESEATPLMLTSVDAKALYFNHMEMKS